LVPGGFSAFDDDQSTLGAKTALAKIQDEFFVPWVYGNFRLSPRSWGTLASPLRHISLLMSWNGFKENGNEWAYFRVE